MKCPYVFKKIRPNLDQPERDETEDDLMGDNLKQYEADIEAMNLIFISIPNNIYNYVDSCQTAQDMCLRVQRLMQGTDLTDIDRETQFNNKFYQFTAKAGESLILTSVMMLLSREITKHYSTPTDNQLRSSSNTRNQAVVLADKVNLDMYKETSLNFFNSGKAQMFSYNCGAKGHYAWDCPKPRVQDYKYFMEQMLLAKKDEARVILSNEHNDFLLADAVQMEEIEELSANICMMSRIQQAYTDFDEGPSYDSSFIKVNDGSVEHDKNARDSHDNEPEQLARNAYKEAEKQHILDKKNTTMPEHRAKMTWEKMRFKRHLLKCVIKVIEGSARK
ncbi:retrovirus-related pol polyprotein from transposon TNT 1-94 [Tanacetum coccineum]